MDISLYVCKDESGECKVMWEQGSLHLLVAYDKNKLLDYLGDECQFTIVSKMTLADIYKYCKQHAGLKNWNTDRICPVSHLYAVDASQKSHSLYDIMAPMQDGYQMSVCIVRQNDNMYVAQGFPLDLVAQAFTEEGVKQEFARVVIGTWDAYKSENIHMLHMVPLTKSDQHAARYFSEEFANQENTSYWFYTFWEKPDGSYDFKYSAD